MQGNAMIHGSQDRMLGVLGVDAVQRADAKPW